MVLKLYFLAIFIGFIKYLLFNKDDLPEREEDLY